MSPTADGREWLTSKKIATRLTDKLSVRFKSNTAVSALLVQHHDKIVDAIQTAYEDTGYTTEFKILRLTEQLKDSVMRGDITDIVDVKNAFKSIYTKSVLELYDEEGNLKDGM